MIILRQKNYGMFGALSNIGKQAGNIGKAVGGLGGKVAAGGKLGEELKNVGNVAKQSWGALSEGQKAAVTAAGIGTVGLGATAISNKNNNNNNETN